MDAKAKRQGKKFKGSVLFTILVVMVVMLMLMITAIGLAGSASRRAYTEYFDHQTNSTARSVVESVVYAMGSGDDDARALGQTIVGQIKSGGSVDVQVNGGNALGEGFGTVDRLTFEKLADDSPTGINITGSGKPIIKVTAVVTQGGVTSTYSQICIGNLENDSQTSSGGGLIALGGFEGVAEPGVDAHSPAYFGVKNPFDWGILVTLSNPNNGGFNSLVVNSSAKIKTSVPFSFGKQEGASIMGNLLLTDGTTKINWATNDTPSSGAVAAADAAKAAINSQIDDVINAFKNSGDLSAADSDGLFDPATTDVHNYLVARCGSPTDWDKYNRAKNERAKVDALREKIINIDNNLGAFDTLNEYYTNAGSANAIDNPYLYVGGTLYLNNGLAVGSSGAPINVYCGRIVTEGNGEIYGNANIYCYNDSTDAESYDQTSMESFAKNPWSKIGTDNLSRLLSWAEQTANPSANRNTSLDTGSLATMGNLRLTKKVSLAGDLFVNGNLVVDSLNTGDSHISGNVYVKGSITGDKSGLDTICDGTIYEGSAVTSSVLPSRFSEFLNGSFKKENITTNVVKTATALYDNFYVDKKDTNGNVVKDTNGHAVKTYKDAVNESQLNVSGSTIIYYSPENGKVEAKYLNGSTPAPTVTSGTVNGFDYKVKITDSCILQGDFGGTNIFIQPDKEICINCFNFDLKNNSNIVIDDSKGKVSFFFPTDPSDTKVDTSVRTEYNALFSDTANTADSAHPYKNYFRTDSETSIQTLAYYNNMKAGNDINIVTNPTADSDTTNDWMLPKVGFYAKEADGDYSTMLVQFTNNVFLTGDICMPSADFYAKSGCTDGTANKMTYNGNKIKSGKIGCIGSIIVNKIKEFNNDFGMVYVDDPSTAAPSINTGAIYEWEPIDGFANY